MSHHRCFKTHGSRMNPGWTFMEVKRWKGWRMSCDEVKLQKGWRMSRACDLGEGKEGLENELWRRWSNRRFGEWALLIPQPFSHFTYVTTHSPTLLSLYLHHSSFSNPSVVSPTSQLILKLFFYFSYVTSSSLNSSGEPPMCSNTGIEKFSIQWTPLNMITLGWTWSDNNTRLITVPKKI